MLFRQFLIEWKLYARDRVALFWTFLFPVLMLLAFGVIFRSGNGPAPTLVRVVPTQATVLDQQLDASLARSNALKVLRLSAHEAEAKWHRGETAAQLESTPDGFKLRVNTYLVSEGLSAAQGVQQAYLMAQARAVGAEPRLIPQAMESPKHLKANNYAAFLLPGLIGLNLLSMGLFHVGMVAVTYREKGKYRRLGVTPLPRSIFLGAQVLHRLTLVVLQCVVMLVVGYFAFGISNQGSYLDLAIVIALGTACFMTLGFALSSFAETTETYGAISNILFLPMMLLSGVYFTLNAAPVWLQRAVVVLPLSPYLKTLRGIFNDGDGLREFIPGLCIVGAWALLCFFIAVRRFRWN